jgi:hypothetical protein
LCSFGFSEIGFVLHNLGHDFRPRRVPCLLSPSAGVREPEIGFVWVCFHQASNRSFFYNILLENGLHSSGIRQIGFVFQSGIQIWRRFLH